MKKCHFEYEKFLFSQKDYTIALKHIPWVIKYYEDDLDAQAKIQREWALYRADLETID